MKRDGAEQAAANPREGGPRRGFGGPIVLNPDDKPAFPNPPEGFDKPREGIAHGNINVLVMIVRHDDLFFGHLQHQPDVIGLSLMLVQVAPLDHHATADDARVEFRQLVSVSPNSRCQRVGAGHVTDSDLHRCRHDQASVDNQVSGASLRARCIRRLRTASGVRRGTRARAPCRSDAGYGCRWS